MKGVVFTEFYEFVEEQHSPMLLQEIINHANLESRGVYTATGTYPTCEMGALVTTLAEKTDSDVSALLKLFGEHLCAHFYKSSPHFFDNVSTAFDLLASVETHIHVDVKKLYPDAELPTFEILEHTKDRFIMLYKSSRGLGDLCEGLIKGCLDHYEETARLQRTLITNDPITIIKFTLEK